MLELIGKKNALQFHEKNIDFFVKCLKNIETIDTKYWLPDQFIFCFIAIPEKECTFSNLTILIHFGGQKLFITGTYY